MSRIRFERIETDLTFHNPLKDFAEDLHRIEVRKDPLLGTTSVYNAYLKDKAKAFFGDNDPDLIKRLIEESAQNCFFCGEGVEKNTPMYTADLLPAGRMRVGEALLFANLFPIGKYHPVVCLCKAHFLRPSEFRPDLVANGLMVSQQFLNIVYEKDPDAVFATVNSNYLFPAGASLVHPHLQMLVTPTPYSHQARLVEACAAYKRETGVSYYDDLVRAEMRAGLRYIEQRGRWHWITAFSPTGTNEVMAIHESEQDFGLITEGDLRELADGISRVLAFYEGLGHLSFNYALHSARGSHGDGTQCILRMITRQNLYPNYRNDDYFLQKMLGTELIITPPEDLAEALRDFF